MSCNNLKFTLFPTGQQGIQGEKGDRGLQGIQGIQGIQGEKGDRGLKGEKGDRGLQGIQGIQGEKGDRGLKGEKGDRGLQGEKGDRGFSINPKPHITSNTNIFDTDVNDFYYNQTNGHAYISKLAYTHPTEPITILDERYFLDIGKIQGEKGDRGLQGEKGDRGESGTTSWYDIIGKPSTFTPSSHNHNGDVLKPDTIIPRAIGNGNSILMHSSLDGNSKNLGYSGSKFNQVSAYAIWGDSGAVSDIKHKENIRYFDNDKKLKVKNIDNDVQVTKDEIYDFITNMKLCQYNYTDKYTSSKIFYNKVGFIANDVVEDKIGRLFVEEHEGSLAYNTNNLIFMLLATVQVQNKKILELEKEIKKTP